MTPNSTRYLQWALGISVHPDLFMWPSFGFSIRICSSCMQKDHFMQNQLSLNSLSAVKPHHTRASGISHSGRWRGPPHPSPSQALCSDLFTSSPISFIYSPHSLVLPSVNLFALVFLFAPRLLSSMRTIEFTCLVDCHLSHQHGRCPANMCQMDEWTGHSWLLSMDHKSHQLCILGMNK